MSTTKTKPDTTKSNGTKPKSNELDQTQFNLSAATHHDLLLNYANGRSTVKQRIVSVTVKKGGAGVSIVTEDAA